MSIPDARILFSACAATLLLLVGCEGTTDDPTLMLTGTESQPLVGSSGAPTCPSPKVLICHIPPGNPANAHSICVGQPAVKAHTSHHSDGLGACGGGASTDAGAPPPPADAGTPNPTPDAGPVCLAINASCSAQSAACCAGLICGAAGTCYPLVD